MTLIVVGVTVSVKRVWLGYYFGRRICGTSQFFAFVLPVDPMLFLTVSFPIVP
jgi:hypothetical protein